MNLFFKNMKDEESMTPPPSISRGKRNPRSHNHALKAECLPLDQAAKIVEMDETRIKRIRSKNFTEQEKDVFAKIVTKYLPIVTIKKIDSASNKIKTDAWERITQEFNFATGNQKTPEQIHNLYNIFRKKNYRFEENQSEGQSEANSQDFLNYDSSTDGSIKLPLSDNENELDISTSVNKSPKLIARARNYTEMEKELFTNICAKYLPVINSRRQDQKSIEKRNEIWDKIAHEYNNAGVDDTIRSTEQLRILFKNLKQASISDVLSVSSSVDDIVESNEKEASNSFDSNSFANREIVEMHIGQPYELMPSTSRPVQKRVRSRNFTEAEKDAFLQIVSEYIHIIENKSCHSSSLQTKSAAWEKIAKEYNVVTGNQRSCEQLNQLYNNLKKKAKKVSGGDKEFEIKIQETFNKTIETNQNFMPILQRFEENPYFDNNSTEYYEEDMNYSTFQNAASNVAESSIVVKIEETENLQEILNENPQGKRSLPEEIHENIPEKLDQNEDYSKIKFLEREHEMKMKILKLELETKEKICAIDLLIKEKEKVITENNEKLSILNLEMKQKELAIKEIELKKLMAE